MDSELTNLLPLGRQRALSREYFLRLGVIGAVLLTILVLMAAVLLLPTFVFLSESATAKEEHLANIESTLSSADEKALSAHLAVLSNNATVLLALGNAPSASTIIRTLLTVPHSGVSLSGLSYIPVAGGTPGTLVVSGTATTREALRSYQLTLQSAPFVTTANLPVSAYAKDADISFTITMILAP